jgi:hypothetical protein
MPKLTEEQLSHARQLFLASPDGAEARKRVESLTEKNAEFMFTTLESMELCMGTFHHEYNDVWPGLIESLEDWIETNDAELEATK